MSLKRRAAFVTILLLALLIGCLAARADVVITEVMTDNGEYDTNGHAYDWIELCNTGSKPVDLSGWGLTESKTDLYAFAFPSGTSLKAGEYALIYCCGEDKNTDRPQNKTYYAHYKLSSSGETIRLTDKDGNEVQALQYPKQFPGFTWGLAASGTDYGFFAAATPRKKNPAQVYETQAAQPVISLSTDKDYMYGKKGLFVKPNYNTDWEYPIHMEYFDENGVRQINQFGSFHIVGTSTRAQKQKSFAVYARTAYGGENRFHYNPFPERDYEEYRTFTIRSTGSDAFYCRMKDLVLTRLANGLDIMYLAGKTCVVYINGAYSGQYNIREKVNKYSIAQWEGITDKDLIDHIDIIKGEARDDQVQNGDPTDWRELRAFVKSHDLNVPENLQYVTDRLDVDSLFTWTCFELCIMNQDLENVRVYRVPGGKWKYVLYDVESGGELRDNAVYMLLNSAKAGKTLSSQYSLIKNLLLVPEMRAKFLARLAEVMEHSFLYSETVKPEIERNEELLKQLLPRHFTIYKNNNMNEWRQNVKAFKRCIRIAPKQVLKLVTECLKVTPEEQQTYFKAVQERLEVTNAEAME